ncbi:aldehyde dehydrogenase family protein [Escherichia coli]
MARAVEEGARVALGGKAVDGKGYYYPLTLLLDVRQEMSIMHEGAFWPGWWLHLTRWKMLSQWLMTVITVVILPIYTQNLNVAMKAIKGLKFGETYINREKLRSYEVSNCWMAIWYWRRNMVNMACMNICRPRWFIYSLNE